MVRRRINPTLVRKLKREQWVRHVLASAVALLSMMFAAPAGAAELWSTLPDPFPCDRRDNACVTHTGFVPTTSHWGQTTNTLGNCTNYAAYRLQKNGATQLSGTGNAITWRDRAMSQFGAEAVNSTPNVGSIAWWGSKAGPDGHVAYVEKVDGGTIYVSESVWNYGSRRRTLTAGTAAFPDAFLHIKDAPAERTPDDLTANVQPADFNGDGRRDLLLVTPRGATGLNFQVALSNGTTFGSFGLWTNTGSNYTLADTRIYVGDFNGDSRTDLGLVTPRGATGLNFQVALSNGTTFGSFGLWTNTGSNYTLADTRIYVGDFNGDSRTDLGLVTPRGATGLNFQVALSNGTTFGSFGLWTNTGSNYTLADTRIYVGDFNGDSRTDLGLVTPRGATGLNFQVALSNGTTFGSFGLWTNTGSNYTLADTRIYVGDFNGDSRTDLGLVTPRGATGLNFQVALSNGTTFGSFGLWTNTGSNYTLADTRIYVGDFNGDSRTDLGLVTPRGATGLNFQVALSNGTTFGSFGLWTNTGSNYTLADTRIA